MIVLEDNKITINGEEHTMAGLIEWSIDRDFRWDRLRQEHTPTGLMSCSFKWQTRQGVTSEYSTEFIPCSDFQDLRS